jgi:hypothetical protein
VERNDKGEDRQGCDSEKVSKCMNVVGGGASGSNGRRPVICAEELVPELLGVKSLCHDNFVRFGLLSLLRQ